MLTNSAADLLSTGRKKAIKVSFARVTGKCKEGIADRWSSKQLRYSPSGSNDSSGIVDDNLHDSAESDLRVSLVDNGLVGPYSATVLVTLPSAPDHRPPRLASAR
ncbi:hypothetical protein TNCV_658711 [Trichonephila clavipes]|uniref:Uncharacterized protein n=1 Tax=Trichonephila clavipes TaxID=2585209 RepID=A0A8X6STL9_TRICX|nr:hypothetical protein TNCV_658711 [Trichonephila clavipes]